MFTVIDKALTATILPAILPVIIGAVTEGSASGKFDWKTALMAILTGIGTYLVPNKKA